jgi:hypothetical protein
MGFAGVRFPAPQPGKAQIIGSDEYGFIRFRTCFTGLKPFHGKRFIMFSDIHDLKRYDLKREDMQRSCVKLCRLFGIHRKDEYCKGVSRFYADKTGWRLSLF